MNALAALPAKLPRPHATTLVRLLCLIVALSAFLAIFVPLRRIGQIRGWRLGRSMPARFHRLICAGLAVRVRSHGQFSPDTKQLIVANHVSWLDIPVLAMLGPMSFLAKKEIGQHPVGRALVAMQGVVYVDRGRRSCIPSVNARMAETMRAGSPVVLFAEATTGDGNRLLRFRSSHFEAIRQAASSADLATTVIQPVYLDYSRLAGLPIARGERPRVAWYGDMTFLRHFFQFIQGGGVTCDVYIGAPIRVLPQLDRKTAARLAEASVRGLAARARATPAAAVFLAQEKAYIGGDLRRP
ncbi:MAG: lysophospholipid acyltransferase family protein [Roseiarcus sp.]|uniref:lysophospholipid acyltransferase family protein n=2 Tax=Roseiarcus sp. TaxID=1969460 RepID=UPI003BAE694C